MHLFVSISIIKNYNFDYKKCYLVRYFTLRIAFF